MPSPVKGWNPDISRAGWNRWPSSTKLYPGENDHRCFLRVRATVVTAGCSGSFRSSVCFCFRIYLRNYSKKCSRCGIALMFSQETGRPATRKTAWLFRPKSSFGAFDRHLISVYPKRQILVILSIDHPRFLGIQSSSFDLWALAIQHLGVSCWSHVSSIPRILWLNGYRSKLWCPSVQSQLVFTDVHPQML